MKLVIHFMKMRCFIFEIVYIVDEEFFFKQSDEAKK